MHMSCRPMRAKPDHDARMLDRFIPIVKLSADCADIRALRIHQKLFHPVDRNYLRIIV